MGRPAIPEIERLANRFWLAKLLADWRQLDARNGKRFTLTAVARTLLSVGSSEGVETTADRERLQALTTIQRIGSNPRQCRRFFPSDIEPPNIDEDVVEVTSEVARRRRPGTSGRGGRYFVVDAVARAEKVIRGSAAWHRPVLVQVLRPPAPARDETRALIALELAKLGFVRSGSLVREQARRRFRKGDRDPEVISADLWSRALAPLEHGGTIESLGILALLLHEQRISFESESVCQSICDTLLYALEGLLVSEGLEEFYDPLERHIYERLWCQRWQADLEDEGSDSLGTPVSMRKWLARCKKIPWHTRQGGLPDLVVNSDLAEQTLEAMSSALARTERRKRKGSKPSAEAMNVAGISELRRRAKQVEFASTSPKTLDKSS